MERKIYLLLLTLAILLASGCVTQKRRDEASGISKLYHNTTAKYNGYFNANEILIATTTALEQQHQDNYQELLDVFPYMAVDNPKAAAGELDKAIEKVTTVVALHRKSHWTDDSYLLVGKAQFLKQDFEASEETLRYLVAEFNPAKPSSSKSSARSAPLSSRERAASAKAKAKEREALQKEREKTAKQKQQERKKSAADAAKARKKYNKEVQRMKKKGVTPPKPGAKPATPAPKPGSTEAEKKAAKKKEAEAEAKKKAEAEADQPENYFLKHRPVYQEGVLWLAKTLIERGNEESALRLLTDLQQDPNTFDDIRDQQWPILAYLQLKRGEPDKAVEPLVNAVATAKRRTDRARYAYLLAQIHQRAGRWQQAYAAFEQVLSFNPTYDMEFNARLNMAQNDYRSGQATAANARQQLDKMVKDEKNLEYRDQIYFTLAMLALEEKDKQGAIDNLRLSLQNNTNNNRQRADAYYELGQLYFEEEQYVEAKLHYDSTLTALGEKDKRYAGIKALRDNLTDIAQNISTIQEQDSLLKLSYMSEEDLKKLATKIKKEQEEKRLAELANAQTAQAPQAFPAADRRDIGAPPTPQAAGTETLFFAYNDRTLKRGQREFLNKWGNRKLEDNWRRTARQGAGGDFAQQPTGEPAKPAEGALTLSQEEIQQVLGDIPKTEADRKAVEFRIAEAMFRLGVLYRERLNNNLKAKEVLANLDQRFPRNNFELDSWYYLYLTCTDLNDPVNAQKYADKIYDRYPNSNYARVLKDPNFVVEIADQEKKVNQYYDRAFDAFSSGRYQEAYDLCIESRTSFTRDNPLAARFALLGALCVGNLKGKEAYQTALNEVIAKFPNTDEEKRAREILRFLGGATASLPGGQQETGTEGQSNFVMESESIHYILIAGDQQMNLNDAKNALSDYQRKYHKLDKLTITSMFLGDDEATRIPLLIVRRLNNREEAMKYYNGVMQNRQDFIPGNNYRISVISLNNYRELLAKKSIDAYQSWFEANYLK